MSGAGLTRRQKLLRYGVALFVVLAIASFAVALREAWKQTESFPTLWRFVSAAALWTLGLLGAAYAWATLLGGDRRIDNGAAALVAQVAKYVPGGVWQASGQVGLARSTGVPIKRGVVAFTVSAIVYVVAAASFGILLAITWSEGSWWLRGLIALGSVASLALTDRRWMVWALHRIPRTRDSPDALVPQQRAIVLATAGSLVTIATLGTGYLIMLAGIDTVDEPWLVVSAFGIAWLVGFVLVPLPSGLGAREAVLVGLLHGAFPPSVVVAASVYHRLIQIATEGLMALIASHRVRPSRLRAAAMHKEELS